MKKFNKQDINEIIDYYKTHSDNSTATYFHIKVVRLKRILEENNILLHTSIENKNFQVKQLRETCLQRFGVSSNLALKEVYSIGQQRSSEVAMAKYGVKYAFDSEDSVKKRNTAIRSSYAIKSDDIIKKREKTCCDLYGCPAYSQTDEWKLSASKNRLNTILAKYGDLDTFYSNIIEKGIETKQATSSFGTNVCEDLFFDYLRNYFNESDIYRQYRDERYCRDDGYKYRCDFYIKSIDTFIELNLFQSHYFELFDEHNKEHVLKLEQCKVKPKNWVDSALIDVWAGTDVKKRNCAINNNLNYIQIYWTQFKDILEYKVNFIDEVLGINLISDNQYAVKIS